VKSLREKNIIIEKDDGSKNKDPVVRISLFPSPQSFAALENLQTKRLKAYTKSTLI